MKINNDKIELFNGIALLKDDQCICRFIRESGRLDHDINILPLVLEYIPIGGTVFDIGAFIGDTTLAYANRVGENGTIYAFDGNIDTCIAIRTVLFRNNKAYVQAGAGIVSDSDPEKEFTETEMKALAVINAIKEAGRL